MTVNDCRRAGAKLDAANMKGTAPGSTQPLEMSWGFIRSGGGASSPRDIGCCVSAPRGKALHVARSKRYCIH